MQRAAKPAADAPDLLERSVHLSTLRDTLATVGDEGRGLLVLLGGEAGAGKTALVQRFCTDVDPPQRILWGACDPLFTPRPLGPFLDIAQRDTGDGLHSLLDVVKPHEVAAAIIRDAPKHARTVLVLEDMHWADEASLDVLSLLGRRIESVGALVIATYRDDELGRTHPLRMLLGELRSSRSIRRLQVGTLSHTAVEVLAAPHGADAKALYEATSGNPFFVTEALAAGSGDIPPTVRDAVLARAARLSPAASTVIEAVAIAPPQVELWLLDALVADGAASLDQCLSSGMLVGVPGGVAFRHELARITVEELLPPHRRLALHRSALGALEAPPAGPPDLARLSHHAEAAGDTEAVLRFAPAAAEEASSIGSHREAAAQLARALRFADGLSADGRAGLLERSSYEAYVTDQSEEGVVALERAVECRREAGNQLGEGAALSSLSRRQWCAGRIADAETVGREAVGLLEGLPPGRELAQAYGILGQLSMNAERLEETLEWGTRALTVAEGLGETQIVVDSLINLGTMQMLAGMPEGLEMLERSLVLAEREGMDEDAGRVLVNLGWVMTRTRAYELAPRIDRGIEMCAERGLERWVLYLMAYRARCNLDRGQWDEAAREATHILRSIRSAPLLRILAFSVLGLVRARRGDPEQWPPLDEALTLAEGQDTLQFMAPVATARAEAAWLAGRGALVEEATRPALEVAKASHAPWVIGELAWLRRVAGVAEEVPVATGPYATQLAGGLGAAAEAWTRLGCPYDAALALVMSEDDVLLRQALGAFQGLGAGPAAAIVARRLRERGVRGLPRGPRPETRQSPAQLTRRETQVLALVSQGAGNAEVAASLFLSERTVHHHVSAILHKLGVTSRGQASAAAARLGLVP